jgi:hypothetical protein
MKKIILLSIVSIVLFAASCGSDPKAKLIGTWKVEKVDTDFDETKVTPEMITQIVEMQKGTFFKFVNDSSMEIVSSNNTHKASWLLDKEGNISFFFKGQELKPTKLGIVEDGKIISTTKSPLGSMKIWYVKE